MKINNIINQTFQYPISRKSRWMISGFISSFTFLFLSVFEPFNLWNVEIERRYFISFGYGLIAFVVLYLNHIVAYRYMKTHLLAVKGLILWYVLNTFLTGLFSAIFNDIIFNWQSLVSSHSVIFLESFLYFQYWFFVLFLIPSIILILIHRNYYVNSIYLKQIENIRDTDSQPIIIHADNPINDFKTEASHLIYMTSANNYVDICYLKEGKAKHILLRNTLKNIEDDLKTYPTFFRCHKGYIINLKKVNKISGGVGTIKLHLNVIEETIPVSRSLTKLVRERLRENIQ